MCLPSDKFGTVKLSSGVALTSSRQNKLLRHIRDPVMSHRLKAALSNSHKQTLPICCYYCGGSEKSFKIILMAAPLPTVSKIIPKAPPCQ